MRPPKVRANIVLCRATYDWLRQAATYLAEREGGKANASAIVEAFVRAAAQHEDLEVALAPVLARK
jgi:hypothetical protein